MATRKSKKSSGKPSSPAKAAGAKRKTAEAPLVVPAPLQRVVAAFANEKRVTLGKGWGADSLALKAKGKIFALVMRGDLVLKLPASRVDEIVKAHGATRFDPRRDGRVMKEWVVLPLDMPSRVTLAREAFEFVVAGGK